jgi:alpha-beta hydrolase superfamily lysophospholipase
MKKSSPIFRWIKIFILFYSVLGISFYYLQEKIIFHPVSLTDGIPFHFDQPFKEINIDIDDATHYNIISFTVPDSEKKGIVLYFHGNRENVNRYAKFAKNFTENGWEVWMVDYPKFGKSTGELTESNLYEEALQVYKLARVKYPPNQIIIYGKSIGTGIAAQLASIRDCRELILETPYKSMVSLVRHYTWILPVETLLHFKLTTDQYLTKVTAPITIFHGTKDGLIPLSNAESLKSTFKTGDQFIIIEGGTHHNLNDFPQMHEKLKRILSR